MMRLRLVVRLRAWALGRYPSLRAASITFSRVASETLAPGVKVRLTADCETLARRATSMEVTLLFTVQPQIAVHPPSTISALPVTSPAASEARNTTALAMSSGSPMRPIIAKAAKHTDACTYLHLIAQVALHSQWVLSEALVVVADCMALDPRPGLGHPREAANDWALVGIQAANVWEARTNGGGVWLGDVERINELVRALSKQCAQWQIMQEELSLSDRKAAFTRRYAAREVTA